MATNTRGDHSRIHYQTCEDVIYLPADLARVSLKQDRDPVVVRDADYTHDVQLGKGISILAPNRFVSGAEVEQRPSTHTSRAPIPRSHLASPPFPPYCIQPFQTILATEI